VGLLAWLGLQRGNDYPNLNALVGELRRALPNDESVVIRYIAVVIALLARVARVDGRFTDKEEAKLRVLLAHVDRLAPSGVESVCEALRGELPSISGEEIELCYRELKAICDGKERLEVMRVLTSLATADGELSPEEEAELRTIATEIGIPAAEVEAVVMGTKSVGG